MYRLSGTPILLRSSTKPLPEAGVYGASLRDNRAPFLLWRLGNPQVIALACGRSWGWVGLVYAAIGGDSGGRKRDAVHNRINTSSYL